MATKYRVQFLPTADRDLDVITNALAAYPRKAERLFQEMRRKLERLKSNPFMWPVYDANPKYRRVLLEGHSLFYKVDETEHKVVVYYIYYAKRDIENLLKD
jgi:plasmid stabilization system protein ParE